MELTVLGSGSAIPDPKRGSPGVVVDVDGTMLLIDCGSGNLSRAAHFGIPVTQVDFVLLTHLHPDHTGDLVPLLFALRNPEIDRQKGLNVVGPEGVHTFMDGLGGVYGEWVRPKGYHLEIQTLRSDTMDFGLWRVRSFPVEHSTPCLAYEVTDARGHRLVYAGDTDYCPALATFARDADLLVLECSFPEGSHRPGHLTPSLAGKIALEARCRRLMLTHFYPACQGKDLVTPCKQVFPGPVLTAEDGLKVQV